MVFWPESDLSAEDRGNLYIFALPEHLFVCCPKPPTLATPSEETGFQHLEFVVVHQTECIQNLLQNTLTCIQVLYPRGRRFPYRGTLPHQGSFPGGSPPLSPSNKEVSKGLDLERKGVPHMLRADDSLSPSEVSHSGSDLKLNHW